MDKRDNPPKTTIRVLRNKLMAEPHRAGNCPFIRKLMGCKVKDREEVAVEAVEVEGVILSTAVLAAAIAAIRRAAEEGDTDDNMDVGGGRVYVSVEDGNVGGKFGRTIYTDIWDNEGDNFGTVI